jgi:Sec23/Sec24 trunk domain
VEVLQVREPMPPTHFFLIDVSYDAVSTGATAAACAAVARVLDDLQGAAPLESTRILGLFTVVP